MGAPVDPRARRGTGGDPVAGGLLDGARGRTRTPEVDTVYVDNWGKAMRCVGTTLMLWDRDPGTAELRRRPSSVSVLCGGRSKQ